MKQYYFKVRVNDRGKIRVMFPRALTSMPLEGREDFFCDLVYAFRQKYWRLNGNTKRLNVSRKM